MAESAENIAEVNVFDTEVHPSRGRTQDDGEGIETQPVRPLGVDNPFQKTEKAWDNIDSELDDLTKQFSDGLINASQLTRLMNKVITKRTTKGKVNERWESKLSELESQPVRSARPAHLISRADQGTRSLQNLYSDSRQGESHAKSQPDVLSSIGPHQMATEPDRPAALKTKKKTRSGIIKHVRISEPEVAEEVSLTASDDVSEKETTLSESGGFETDTLHLHETSAHGASAVSHEDNKPETTNSCAVEKLLTFGTDDCYDRSVPECLERPHTDKEKTSRQEELCEAAGQENDENVQTVSPTAEINDIVRGRVQSIRSKFETIIHKQTTSPSPVRNRWDSVHDD